MSFVPLGPSTEVDLNDLAFWARELVHWLGPESCPPDLVALISCAPSPSLDDLRRQLDCVDTVRIPWRLDAIVNLVLVPLAELSLVDEQPVIPDLGATLVSVLADPRLGDEARDAIELVLLDSEECEGVLEAEARGGP